MSKTLQLKTLITAATLMLLSGCAIRQPAKCQGECRFA